MCFSPAREASCSLKILIWVLSQLPGNYEIHSFQLFVFGRVYFVHGLRTMHMRCIIDIVTGGTDSHMVLVDLRSKNVTGKDAEESLERAGMTCNKNGVANDPNPPTITSGIRLGSPAATTRGFKEEEFKFIGEKISTIINALSSSNADISMTESSILKDVTELCSNFPIYK